MNEEQFRAAMSVRHLHETAMNEAEAAAVAKLRGHHRKARMLTHLAFGFERQAAECMRDTAIEPTRSVLYRSAATMALQCGNRKEARRLALAGLDGQPPAEIAAELRDVLAAGDPPKEEV